MGKTTTEAAIVLPPAAAAPTPSSNVAAAGMLAQGRLLVTDQLAPALRTAYLRAAPVVVDARGRVQNTVEVRVIPAVRDAGGRLGPVVTTAAVRAGATARTAGTTVNVHARPVAAEAARRGRNTLDALLGSDPVPAPVVPAADSRGRVLRWLVVAGAVAGASYGAWQVRTRRIGDPGPDIAGEAAGPVVGPVLVVSTVADLPAAVPDPKATPVVITVESTADDVHLRPGVGDGDLDSSTTS